MMHWPVAKDIGFKNVYILALVAMFNFSRGQHKIHFCEIILILDLWFRRKWYLNIILSRALESLLFCGAEPFVQFLVEDIKSNNSVKLF